MGRFKDTSKTSTQLLADLAYHARSVVDPQIVRDIVTSAAAGIDTTATATELNNAADLSAQDAMAASTVMTATLASYDSAVVTQGGITKTTIILDLTGAKSTTTLNDIIGDTGACDIGQITAAVNGAVIGGKMTCLEVPTTGVADIDLSMASVNTGAYDADVTALTNYGSLVSAGAAWTLGLEKGFGPVTADYYLYLSSGVAGTPGTYDAGIFMLEFWSV